MKPDPGPPEDADGPDSPASTKPGGADGPDSPASTKPDGADGPDSPASTKPGGANSEYYAEKHLERMRELAALRENVQAQPEDREVFRFAIATPYGMVESHLKVDPTIQCYNRDDLTDMGYHKETRLAKKSGALGQLRVNHAGFIHVEIWFHGREKPSIVAIHIRQFKFSIQDRKMRPFQDEEGNWHFPLNKPLLCARIWAQKNLQGWENTLEILAGPTELLEPRSERPSISIRAPTEEELKRRSPGRPAKPTPSNGTKRPPHPKKVIASQQPETPPGIEFTQFERDAVVAGTHAWLIREYSNGSSYKALLPIHAVYRKMGISPDPAEPGAADLLAKDAWPKIFVERIGEGGATSSEIVRLWSGGQIDENHPAFAQYCTRVRSVIGRNRKFEYNGTWYSIQNQKIRDDPRHRTRYSIVKVPKDEKTPNEQADEEHVNDATDEQSEEE